MTAINKIGNGYQKFIDSHFFEKCPKKVFAAIAVSYLINHQSMNREDVTKLLKEEWKALNENGIVPQKPFK